MPAAAPRRPRFIVPFSSPHHPRLHCARRCSLRVANLLDQMKHDRREQTAYYLKKLFAPYAAGVWSFRNTHAALHRGRYFFNLMSQLAGLSSCRLYFFLLMRASTIDLTCLITPYRATTAGLPTRNG